MQRIALFLALVLTLTPALAGIAAQPPAAPETAAETCPVETPAVFVDAPEATPVMGPPQQEECPGEFDISRWSSFYDCNEDNCNQWCQEEGASHSIGFVWVYTAAGGLCGCKCCP